MIKVSNIMGVDPKPFDPKTYVEEDTFVTDESGTRKRIRLENNIVRWRTTRNPDGTTSVSNNIVLSYALHHGHPFPLTLKNWDEGDSDILVCNFFLPSLCSFLLPLHF